MIFFSLHFSLSFAAENQTSRAGESCTSNSFCVRGVCDRNRTTPACVCDRGWVYGKDGSETCTYQQKSKLAAFLLSFFVGGFGADWFYLSTGNGGYIAAGVFKFLTLGGLGIWWLVDWIRILTNTFVDGQGIHLLEWTP